MSTRLNKVRAELSKKNLDAILINKPENRRYVSGFTGTTGFIIITKNEAKFLTDFRYLEQAQNECIGFEVIEISKLRPLTSIIEELHINTLGIEDDYLTYGDAVDLQSRLKHISLTGLDGVLTIIRSIKEEEELKAIEKAAQITDQGFKSILNLIKPGIREIDIALELDYSMRKLGASGSSFSFIVASGKRSSLPHGVASNKIINYGDFVTIDFGCIYDGYCSDMTRTIVVGEASSKQKEIYSIVLRAQETALQSVRPGITGNQLDSIARNIIEKEGYGQYFGHGLGHGVGLEIHELPHVNLKGDVPMEPGMIITIEPGIYLPDFGGVRIEDLVLVTENSYRTLSKTPKELLEIRI